MNFQLGGTAVLGTDYPKLPTSIVIPAGGKIRVELSLTPSVDFKQSPAKTVVLQLLPEWRLRARRAYVGDDHDRARLAGAVFRGVAPGAVGGRLDGLWHGHRCCSRRDGQTGEGHGFVFQPHVLARELTPETRRARPGRAIRGPISTAATSSRSRLTGTFIPSANQSKEDLQKALQDGLIYVAIDTKRYPTGELRGQFIRSPGSMTFKAPSAPPALPGGPPTPADAARFLIQATFGPTRLEIDDLAHKNLSGWIDGRNGSAAVVPPRGHARSTTNCFHRIRTEDRK